MKRKIITLVILTVMSLSLFGCSSVKDKPEDVTKKEETAKEETTKDTSTKDPISSKMKAISLDEDMEYDMPVEVSVNGKTYEGEFDEDSVAYFCEDSFVGVTVFDSEVPAYAVGDEVDEAIKEGIIETDSSIEESNIKTYVLNEDGKQTYVYAGSSDTSNIIVTLNDVGYTNYLLTIIYDMDGTYDISTEDGVMAAVSDWNILE